MAKYIKTSLQINASKELIWKILTDFDRYPEWNPFIKSLSGKVETGNQITVKLNNMVFKPTILKYEKNSEFKWLGHLGLKGLFDGEHKFHLKTNTDGSTTLEQSEKFTGILIHLFPKKMYEDTKQSFIQMNDELKLRAERVKKAT
ncbi:SRPBCC family protein [Carboxylicivirga caseinilyticus]|uniref:SRPBCC family protein n=1 Tax=Carboxylicivirga caseinilyticus TaxID=3417572 RepID=UPI003D32C25D|nr:SRPBCC domain-containing protein [Marinilabiliaceae bacterium A049]